MRFISIIKSEPNWRVILKDIGGNPHFHEVKFWGIPLKGEPVPLNDQYESFYRTNFVLLIDPNKEEPKWPDILDLCREKLDISPGGY